MTKPVINFMDIRDDLVKVIDALPRGANDETLTLCYGFFSTVQSMHIPDPAHGYFPMIACTGNKTKRVIFFALQDLLPDLDF